MLYLLDAGVLITAHRDYYPISRVPEFWAWLQHQLRTGRAKVPVEILEEVQRGNRRTEGDELLDWLKGSEVRDIVALDEELDPTLVQTVVENGYGHDLDEKEIAKMGRDPLLIAYALVDPNRRRIVTTEVSKPRRQRANRKIPDVARDFEITTLDPFRFVRMLDFRTNWQNNLIRRMRASSLTGSRHPLPREFFRNWHIARLPNTV